MGYVTPSDSTEETNWKKYALGLLLFNLIGFLFVFRPELRRGGGVEVEIQRLGHYPDLLVGGVSQAQHPRMRRSWHQLELFAHGRQAQAHLRAHDAGQRVLHRRDRDLEPQRLAEAYSRPGPERPAA